MVSKIGGVFVTSCVLKVSEAVVRAGVILTSEETTATAMLRRVHTMPYGFANG